MDLNEFFEQLDQYYWAPVPGTYAKVKFYAQAATFSGAMFSACVSLLIQKVMKLKRKQAIITATTLVAIIGLLAVDAHPMSIMMCALLCWMLCQ